MGRGDGSSCWKAAESEVGGARITSTVVPLTGSWPRPALGRSAGGIPERRLSTSLGLVAQEDVQPEPGTLPRASTRQMFSYENYHCHAAASAYKSTPLPYNFCFSVHAGGALCRRGRCVSDKNG